MQKNMKLFNGTDPVALFNQGELIDAVIRNMLDDNPKNKKVADRMLAIDGGICYMLSVEWLRLIYTNQNGWDKFCLHPRDNEGKIILKPTELAYYTQIANNFYTYSDLFDDSTKTTLQDAILGKELRDCSNFEIDMKLVPLCFRSENAPIVKKAMKPQRELTSLKNSMNNYFISHTNSKLLVGLYGNEGTDYFGHETAMFRNAENYYFFDPNFGIFKITNMDIFLEDFWNTYNIQKVEITELS
ncbi:MAG: hypothetical protein HDT41_04985 [Lachnospiraceae bacterium]|nr:hypothetical protein [Lachnospiraceae bacterium]